MFKRRSLQGIAAHFAAWVVMYLTVMVVFSSSDSRSAYALLSGWWCALYTAAVLNTPAVASLGAAVIFILVDGIAAAVGLPRMYPNSGPFDLGAIVDSIQRAAVFASPILVNLGTVSVKRRIL